jgi:hypothetical protein
MVSVVSKPRCEWLKARPWYMSDHEQINAILNGFVPNTHVCASMNEHVNIYSHLTECKLFDSAEMEIMLIQMEEGYCHDNCELLFAKNRISTIYVGYALSEDGLWRYHSWGVNEDKIVETCSKRLIYYGVVCV